MKPVLVIACLGTLLLVTVVFLSGGFGWLFEFRVCVRITNLSGKAVAVTSANTLRTTRIADGEGADIPHGAGDITIRQINGKTWLYRNLLPLDAPAAFKVMSEYPIPFGGAKCIVSYLLAPDGRLYLANANLKRIEMAKRKQPRGYPLEPAEKDSSSDVNGADSEMSQRRSHG